MKTLLRLHVCFLLAVTSACSVRDQDGAFALSAKTESIVMTLAADKSWNAVLKLENQTDQQIFIGLNPIVQVSGLLPSGGMVGAVRLSLKELYPSTSYIALSSAGKSGSSFVWNLSPENTLLPIRDASALVTINMAMTSGPMRVETLRSE